ncbi:hypothetical protein AB5I41_17795 [Sphingomonas sp. MMS24-JH45]
MIAGGAAEKLAAHIARMDATGEAAGARLENVTQQAAAAVDALYGPHRHRDRRIAQGDRGAGRCDAGDGRRQSIFARPGRARECGIARRADRHHRDRDRADRRPARPAARDRARTVRRTGRGQRSRRRALRRNDDAGSARVQQLAASVSALEQASAEAMARSLDSGSSAAERSIATAETLLTALDAAVREMDETISDAVERLESRVGQSRAVVTAAKPELLALVTAAESTHDAIEAVAQVVADQRKQVDALTGSLATGREQVEDIGASVEHAVQQANVFVRTGRTAAGRSAAARPRHRRAGCGQCA